MGRLQGKKAVVLGAGTRNNMGQMIARRYRAEGAEVVVAGRDMKELAWIAGEVGGHACPCDLTVEAEVNALADFATDKMGGVSIAVNSTGWGLLAPFLENTREQLERMCALQFTGPFQFYQAMVRAMTGGGSIIQITSATATIMLDNHAAYMGTKAGADHVIRCVANEFGERGIRANSLAPGLTLTPMAADAAAVPGVIDAFVKEYPLGRIGSADDVSAGAVWLASDECFMSGETLHITGGLRLRRNPRAHEIQASVMAAMAKAASAQ